MTELKLKQFLLLVGCLLLGSGLWAQRRITGTVTDAETGEGLIGAGVVAVGANAGTVTDVDGKFTLTVPQEVTQVKVTYTGYAEQTLAIPANNVVNARLAAGQALEEVVVIGYGTVAKSDATGSVNAVSEKDFNRGAIVSPEQLISGKIAGVQVVGGSGDPGAQTAIRIRGGTSVNATNEPLFVIDGIPIDNTAHNPGGFAVGRNPLNFINPSDIETFTVLKDASATAIYGSRGANGVILITTKKGKKGDTGHLTYDGSYTSSRFLGDVPLLNAEEFRNTVTFVAPSRLEDLGTANTNWFDAVTQDASGQTHNLSFSGGGGNTTYRLSAGYQDLQGVIRTSEFERTSLGLNLNTSLFNERVLIGTSLKGAFTKDQFAADVIDAAWRFDPTQDIYDADNTVAGGYFDYGNSLAPRNPVSSIEQIDEEGRTFRTLASMDVEWKMDDLVRGLSAKTVLGLDFTDGNRVKFQPTTYLSPALGGAINGELRSENLTRRNPLFDFYLNYKHDFGTAHSIGLTAGYSYQDFYNTYPSFRAYNLTSDNFGLYSTVPALNYEAGTSTVENRLISFFGRANYSFMDKYLLTATLRRDGSTRFGPNNRWGWFPSAAVAWRIMQEDFAKNLGSVFSDLKLRVGYGVTGNQGIGDFKYLPLYTYGDVRAQYQFGDTYVNTVRPDAYDPNLKWEETTAYNIGLDFGFWNNRLSGTLEYYRKRTDDLLFDVPVAAGLNLTNHVLTNIGSLENKGLELTLDARVLNTSRFTWNVGFNAANNHNKVLDISVLGRDGVRVGGIAGGVGNTVQILQVGQPVNSFFVYEQLYDADGKPRNDNTDYNDDGKTDGLDMYVDQNGDGVLNDLDKRIYKKPAGDWLLGISSQMTYAGFDLGFTLRGSAGNYVYNNNASNHGYLNYIDPNEYYLSNVHASAVYTRFTNAQYWSDYYVEDGSFLRLDNITLGYTINKIGGRNNSLRLYVTGQNLFVWTKYSGIDPEVRVNDSNLNNGFGIDNNLYPRAQNFVFGLSLGL